MKKITFYLIIFMVAFVCSQEQSFAQKLWGMTRNGGDYDAGVIFNYNPKTGTQTVVYSFIGTNGGNPEGSLLKASNGKLYGMACTGGTSNLGVIFEFDIVTGTYVPKFSFNGSIGSHPYGSLIEVSGKLYGMTQEGGVDGKGVIFEYDLATGNYTKKHDFNGTNGATPYGDLLKASNGKLYGLTYQGGKNYSSDNPAYGTIFEFDPTGGTFSTKYSFEFGRGIYSGYDPYGTMIEGSDGRLYGFASEGGPDGVIFTYILPNETKPNGTYTKIQSLNYQVNGNWVNGAICPMGNPNEASDGILYGMSNRSYIESGGREGTIFKCNLSTSTINILHAFTGEDGYRPKGSLTKASNGKLYGMIEHGRKTVEGVEYEFGVLFEFDPVSNTYTKKIEFTGQNGYRPSFTNLIEVIDPLVAVCKKATLVLDAAGQATLDPNSIDGGSTGNRITFSASKTNFDCSNVGVQVVTLTVTDIDGKTSTCDATVTVEDKTAPVAVVQNVTIQLDATGNVSTTTAAVDNGSNDACGIASLVLSKTAFDCSNVGANTVTLTVTDKNGNVSTKDAVVTVVDAVAPVALAQNVTVQLDATGNGGTTPQLIDNGSSDACGLKSLVLDKSTFNCSNFGDNTVTLKVTDNNNNASTITAVVTVEDKVVPVVKTKDITVQLDGTGNVSIVPADINNGSTDNCGIASYALDVTSFSCENVGTPVTVTLTVTDIHGNSNSNTAVVTVQDKVAPVALAQNLTVQLDATGAASITAAQINNGSTDACGIASLVLSKTAFDCSNVGANTVTLTVTDKSGNVSTADAVVIVQDNIAPVLTVPANIVKLNDASVLDIGQATATDNCSVATITNNAPASFPVGSTIVTWTAVDVNGNSTTGTQTVEITNNVSVISNLTVSTPVKLGVATFASATHDNNNLRAATWNWGDGLSSAGTIAGKQISGNHVYSQTGLYNVTLTIKDAWGKSDTKVYSYVVIYNACNGFVTGGGNFITPTGAYSANILLTGKSDFGFEAKYEKGEMADMVPEGEFNFHLKSADFKVKSTSLDWLMVNNDQAILKGSAKVNNHTGYHFIASIVDGGIKVKKGTDYLRLIVWDDAGNVLYDNQKGDPDNARASYSNTKGQVVIHRYKNGKCFGDEYEDKDEHNHGCDIDDDNCDTDDHSYDNDDNENDQNGNKGNNNSGKKPILVEMTVYPNPMVNNYQIDISIKNFGNTVAKVDLAYINGNMVYSIPRVQFIDGKARIDLRQAKLKTGNFMLMVSENGTSRVGVKQIIVLLK